jgi:hypothetical protein
MQLPIEEHPLFQAFSHCKICGETVAGEECYVNYSNRLLPKGSTPVILDETNTITAEQLTRPKILVHFISAEHKKCTTKRTEIYHVPLTIRSLNTVLFEADIVDGDDEFDILMIICKMYGFNSNPEDYLPIKE